MVDSGDLLLAMVVDGLEVVVVRLQVSGGMARAPVVVQVGLSCKCLLAELLVYLECSSSI